MLRQQTELTHVLAQIVVKDWDTSINFSTDDCLFWLRLNEKLMDCIASIQADFRAYPQSSDSIAYLGKRGSLIRIRSSDVVAEILQNSAETKALRLCYL